MVRRLLKLAALWLLCALVSTLTFVGVWGGAALPSSAELIALHLAYGLLALPISFGAIFAAVLPEALSIIPVMVMYAYWPVMAYLQIVYIVKNAKAEGIGAAVLALMASPLWLYYAVGMSGI